jgi:hypothetical protein
MRQSMRQYYTRSTEAWAGALRESCARVDRSLAAGDARALAAAFGNCERDADNRFFDLDRELKGLCDELRALDGLLQTIADAIRQPQAVLP